MKFNRQKYLDETRATRIDKNGDNKGFYHSEYEKDKREYNEMVDRINRIFPDCEEKYLGVITSQTPGYMLVKDIGVRHWRWERRLVSDAGGNLSAVLNSSLIYCQDDDIQKGNEFLIKTHCFNMWRDEGGLLQKYRSENWAHTSNTIAAILFPLLFIAGHIFLAIVTGG